MFTLPDQSGAPRVALRWLIHLRWVAVVGQAVSLWFAWRWLPVPIDLQLIVASLVTTMITNLALMFLRNQLMAVPGEACGLILALDTATLTVMLHASGGANHPFAAFYLLHLTLAGLLLSPRWIAGQLVLCLGCLTWLNFAVENRPGPSHPAVPVELHYQGLLIALGLTGTGIAYFVSRVQADLQLNAAALSRSEALLARQERFAGLATLAAGVAHELATPLGTIAVVSREMERHAQNSCLNGACRDDSRLIRMEVDRCRDIINRLNAEAVDSGEETVDLTTLGQQLSTFLVPAHHVRLRVAGPRLPNTETRNAALSPTLLAPRVALLQSLATLVKNACEADATGGTVALEITDESQAVSFTVRDRGPGMDAATAARVGEPFFTTKAPGEGMGLGLYIVRMFAERLRGKVETDSTPGHGTAVRLIVPHRVKKETNAA